MLRPTTKADLIQAANEQFAKLWSLIDEMSDKEKSADIVPNECDRNVRDVLVHLYEWHCLLLNWIRSNTNGKPSPFLPVPYNWKTYPQMNVVFWEKHQNTSYTDAETMLKKTHKEVMAIIETFSDEELFPKVLSIGQERRHSAATACLQLPATMIGRSRILKKP